MRRIQQIVLGYLLFTLTGCFKKETPITLPQGNSQITTCFIGNDYENNVYFDLSSNAFQTHVSNDWDLRFETADTAWGVFINTGNNLKVYQTDLYSLNDVRCKDSNYFKTFKPLIDAPEGLAITSAIADWRKFKHGVDSSGVYVVNLSYGIGPDYYACFQVLNATTKAYKIAVSRLNQHRIDTFEIAKNSSANYSYFSFANGGQVIQNVEPDQTQWDFMFTRYNHNFMGILPNNQPFPYRVAGVLSNRNGVKVAKDSTTGFATIDATSIPQYHFSSMANAIGYDWKSHSFGAVGNYVVNAKITYIIQDTDGQIYKLRFLDFYNSKAEKGYPKFEFFRIR
jgi:hypothetical protein